MNVSLVYRTATKWKHPVLNSWGEIRNVPVPPASHPDVSVPVAQNLLTLARRLRFIKNTEMENQHKNGDNQLKYFTVFIICVSVLLGSFFCQQNSSSSSSSSFSSSCRSLGGGVTSVQVWFSSPGLITCEAVRACVSPVFTAACSHYLSYKHKENLI